MELYTSGRELRDLLKSLKKEGRSVGFVPTMGFLHEGHKALMVKARRENDILVASVFVNPTQFGPNEDLDAYPRDIEGDKAVMDSAGVDYVFFPTVEEMYPTGYNTYVDVEGPLTNLMEGASREGHFRGVATVVSKLFNLCVPDRAYFGMKDAQQVSVIQRMVEDMNIDVEIIPCPIVREEDGLALSSRNTYLDEKQRKDALVLSRSLGRAREMIDEGVRDAHLIHDEMQKMIDGIGYAKIDYIQIVNARTLEPLQLVTGDVLIALAVWVGKPKLLDNIRLEVE
jgi:pantoate--beta-alanine ligase